jgi:hypothetical protein
MESKSRRRYRKGKKRKMKVDIPETGLLFGGSYPKERQKPSRR